MGKLMVRLAVMGAAAGVAVFAGAGHAVAANCPHSGMMCPMIWDPVICNDGQVYSNSCVARQHCAKGCTPYGGGGVIAAKKPGGGGCPRDILCPDVWDPVMCSDGQVYSNSCYAYAACARGCVPYGDGGPVPVESSGNPNCPSRPRFCPQLWAPVICDDGRVYPNQCWADKKCATGCVPYDDWLAAAGGGNPNCPPRPKFCPLLWAPVICDDGDVYPNQCYADRKCATGCVPYGDELADRGKKKPGGGNGCPRIGFVCPDIYDPVICDDGQTYSNDCVAWVYCATGCEPLGPGPIPVP